jgi:hypothetical protein
MTSREGTDSGRPDELRPPAADAESISKAFGRTKALQDVSLTVAPGECQSNVNDPALWGNYKQK